MARDKTPLLAPIRRSRAPIVIPSAEAISCILDKIVPIRLKIIPENFVGLKIINTFASS